MRLQARRESRREAWRNLGRGDSIEGRRHRSGRGGDAERHQHRSRGSGQEPAEGTRFTISNAGSVYRERYWYQREFDTVDAFLQFAKEAGLKPATLAIAWVMTQPAVTAPNIGASRAEQLADTLAAVEIRLENDLVAKLDTLTREFRRGDATR